MKYDKEIKDDKKKKRGLRGSPIMPKAQWRPGKKEHLGTITPMAC